MRSYLTNLLKKRGLEVNRDTMTKLANELRAANTPSFFAEQLLACAQTELAAAASGDKKIGGAIIESIRTTGEVAALRATGNFLLLAVDAPQKMRYEVRGDCGRLSYLRKTQNCYCSFRAEMCGNLASS